MEDSHPAIIEPAVFDRVQDIIAARGADAVQKLIAQNARAAQDQDEYNVRYDTAVSQYEATKAERDKLAAEIRQRGIRKREFDRFIKALERLPESVTEFDEAIWGSLVEHVTVHSKDDIRFMLPCGTEVCV